MGGGLVPVRGGGGNTASGAWQTGFAPPRHPLFLPLLEADTICPAASGTGTRPPPSHSSTPCPYTSAFITYTSSLLVCPPGTNRSRSGPAGNGRCATPVHRDS